MSLTLRDAITATQTTIDVNGTDTILGGDVFKVDDEYLLVSGTPTPNPNRSFQRISIAERGTGGSTKASHVNGSTLTAANAFAGGADVPDPSTGDDGDVPQVQSGEYVLGPGGGAITFRQVEVVLAFGDAVAGVTLATLAADETMFMWSAFVESAITATADDYLLALFTGAEVLTQGIPPNSSFFNFSASIGQGAALVLPVRGVTVVVKQAAGSSGTWTAGSLRFIALIGAVSA